MAPPTDHDFIYELYKPSDADDMARLFGQVFTLRDPPHVAVGLTALEFEEFVRIFLPGKDTRHLTVVARSAGSGDLAGAMFTDDLASALPHEYQRVSDKFEPIDDMLLKLGEEYARDKIMLPGVFLHLFLLGVAPRFAGQGVGQRLVAEAVSNGSRRGYGLAVTEATNPTSQHIFRKLGFTERVHLSYQDYRFHGKTVFASIAEQGGMILMDKALGAGSSTV